MCIRDRCVATVVLRPVGVSGGGFALLNPWLLLAGFGVLMSLEPAVAALVGFLVLGERLGTRSVAAIVLVTVAAAGASRLGGRGPKSG
jgi:inner membrane transporter RhtA